jgi:hypothetical protein
MTSATDVPVSACLSANAICSSVYRDFFMTARRISDYIDAAALLYEYPKRNGCSPTVATMPTGLGMPWRTRASNPAS